MRSLGFRSLRNAAKAAVILPVLLACQPRDAQAVTKKEPAVERVQRTPSYESRGNRIYHEPERKGADQETMAKGNASYKHPLLDVSCSFKDGNLTYRTSDGKTRTKEKIVDPAETAWDIKCDDSFAHIMTDVRLISVPGNPHSFKREDFEASHSRTMIDMRPSYKRGVVTWTHSDDHVFVVTKDRKLTVLTVAGLEQKALVYDIDYDIRKATAIYDSGFVFIAPANGRLVVYTKDGVTVNFTGFGKGEFYYTNSQLRYGNKEKNDPTIKIKDEKPENIRVLRN